MEGCWSGHHWGALEGCWADHHWNAVEGCRGSHHWGAVEGAGAATTGMQWRGAVVTTGVQWRVLVTTGVLGQSYHGLGLQPVPGSASLRPTRLCITSWLTW